eukprot:gene5393-9206_t
MFEEEEEEEELFCSPETKKKIEIENNVYKEKMKNIHGSPSKMKTKRVHKEVSKLIRKKDKDDTSTKRKLISNLRRDDESEKEYSFSNESNFNTPSPPPPKKLKNDLKDFNVPNDIKISQESWTSNSTTTSVSSSLEDDLNKTKEKEIEIIDLSLSPNLKSNQISKTPSSIESDLEIISKNRINPTPIISKFNSPSLNYCNQIKEIKMYSNIKFNHYCKYLKQCIKEENENEIFEIEEELKNIKNECLKDKKEIIDYLKVYSKIEIKCSYESGDCELCKKENVKFRIKFFDTCYNSNKLWNQTEFEKYKMNEIEFKIGSNCSNNVELYHELIHFKYNIMIKIKNKKSFQNIYKEDYQVLIEHLKSGF